MIVWLALVAGALFAVTLPAQLFGWLCGAAVRRWVARPPPRPPSRTRDPPP